MAVSVSVSAQPPATPSVPSEYLGSLAPPGEGDEILRPSAIFVDRAHSEVLVADPGHNRILIFDLDGTFRFAFSGDDHFSSPSQLAVDSRGYVYVLGTTRDGKRIFRFDFDGIYLGEVQVPMEYDGQRVQLRGMAMDGQDRLYLLDHGAVRMLICDRDGAVMSAFGLDRNIDAELRNELLFGSPTVTADRILVPVSNLGTVQIYTHDGTHLRNVGYHGTNVGQLVFPVDVAVTDESLILVLDKHRFNVVCFDPDGRFLGEFGGRGSSPGWFYHPSVLAADGDTRVYIGQVFQNKVQICRLPEFIRSGFLSATSGRG